MAKSDSNKCHREIHGMTRTKIYKCWSNMRSRCNNPNYRDYHRYGGRGIKICKRWDSFLNFYKDMGECPDRHSIDRIDNHGDYTPENCRWATKEQQDNNRRNNKCHTFDGKTLTIAQWARYLGINRDTLYERINNSKLSVEQALSIPVKKENATGRLITRNGKTLSTSGWSKELGLHRKTIYYHLERGTFLE